MKFGPKPLLTVEVVKRKGTSVSGLTVPEIMRRTKLSKPASIERSTPKKAPEGLEPSCHQACVSEAQFKDLTAGAGLVARKLKTYYVLSAPNADFHEFNNRS